MNKNYSILKKLKALDKKRQSLGELRSQYLPVLFGLPIFTLFASIVISFSPPVIFYFTLISILISFLIYRTVIKSDLKRLTTKVKETLIKEFMDSYHPDIEYYYNPGKRLVKQIIKNTKLVSATRYYEEDVITGFHKDATFYFSEIKLKRSSGKNTVPVFDGFLFELMIPGMDFPKSRILSQRKISQMLFGQLKKDQKHGLWYETQNERKYRETLNKLLPFIAHLKQQQGDLRIQAEGDKITILMKSDMDFLDKPKYSVDRTFRDEQYRTNLAQQLNTLLYIVDAFVQNLDSTEIEDKLELKAIEYERKQQKR